MSEAQGKAITRTKVAAQATTQAPVRVLYGVHALEANLVGRTVSNVRQSLDRKSTRLNSSHIQKSRMPSSA